MSTPRFVRGTKSRLFLYLGAVTVIGVVVYVFHGSQIQLDEVRKTSEKCLQQQESLSAQLQVIFEYKLRLEKSLQQEKAEHRQTREELQGRADEEKQLREKDNLEAINKYTSLQQQYKLLQSEHEDLNSECSKVRASQLQGLEERSRLEAALAAAQQGQVAKDKDIDSLKSQLMRLEQENEKLVKQYKEIMGQTHDSTSKMNHLEKENFQLNNQLGDLRKELQRCTRKLDMPKYPDQKVAIPSSIVKPSSSPVAVLQGEMNLNVLQEPAKKAPVGSSQKSTTPQINPDAVLSNEKTANNVVPVPPPQEPVEKQSLERPAGVQTLNKQVDNKELNEDAAVIPNQPAFNAIPGGLIDSWNNQNQRFNIPAGVVPAPHGYGYHNSENAGHPPEQDNEVLPREKVWPWKGYNHWLPGPQPMRDLHNEEDNVHDIEVGDNPMNQQQNSVGLPRDQNNNNRRRQLAQPHRNAVGFHEEDKEIPRQLHNPYEYNGEYEKEHQRGDLQLEEGEEDEDDDMDQLDYANDGGNAAERQKRINIKPPVANVDKHESVMVNPK